MVENRPWLDFLAHAILLVGVAIVAFPLYITFVASTLTYDQIINVPMPLVIVRNSFAWIIPKMGPRITPTNMRTTTSGIRVSQNKRLATKASTSSAPITAKTMTIIESLDAL